MDKMREEFEAWVVSEFGFDVSKIHGGGAYCSGDTFTAWSAWKASRAALCVELPEHCKGMALTVTELHKQLDKAGVSYKCSESSQNHSFQLMSFTME